LNYQLTEFEYEILKGLVSGEITDWTKLDPAGRAAILHMHDNKIIHRYNQGQFRLPDVHALAIMEFEKCKEEEQNTATAVFNIGSVHDSVFGIGNIANINHETALGEIKNKIDSCSDEDKDELNQIVSLLESILDNQTPVEKGMLSKFSGAIEKHSWLSGSIASTLFGWLIATLH